MILLWTFGCRVGGLPTPPTPAEPAVLVLMRTTVPYGGEGCECIASDGALYLGDVQAVAR